MTRWSSCFVTLLLSLPIAIPAAAQERDARPARQVADDETPVDSGETVTLLGLQPYHPDLGSGPLADEVRALHRSARNHRIAGISLTIPGALLLGTGAVWAASVSASDCDQGLSCFGDALGNAFSMLGATTVGLAGAVLTVTGLAVWASAGGLEDRARRLESMGDTLPWIAPTTGGAVAGMRWTMR